MDPGWGSLKICIRARTTELFDPVPRHYERVRSDGNREIREIRGGCYDEKSKPEKGLEWQRSYGSKVGVQHSTPYSGVEWHGCNDREQTAGVDSSPAEYACCLSCRSIRNGFMHRPCLFGLLTTIVDKV